MLSYPYIESVFKSVLKHSKVMQGRIHVCPQHGTELNTNNLDQVTKHAFGDEVNKKKYPLSLLMPPESTGDYASDHFNDEYEIDLYFLTTSFVNGNNQIKLPNPNTNTSQHSIMFDWHDMKRCAVKFLNALQRVSIGPGLSFYIKESSKPYITPVSTSGNDKVSGVMLSFILVINEACTEEDYPEDFENIISLPDAMDLHPEHAH